ncbi:hypothetical protein MAR_006473 [Mya arenaria]|uniref:Uncharacterized protein n=1 Tax=Mya arenaria TaxID=6604 RepID=A0ABY7D8L0_MYAAR|nr:hypothetical protein MAR_006473 [Mya arenaria]
MLCVCSYAALVEREERSVQIVINDNDGRGDSDRDCPCEAVDVGEECCGIRMPSAVPSGVWTFANEETVTRSVDAKQGRDPANQNSICNPSSGVCECA